MHPTRYTSSAAAALVSALIICSPEPKAVRAARQQTVVDQVPGGVSARTTLELGHYLCPTVKQEGMNRYGRVTVRQLDCAKC
jgi:hypothetical protein